MLFVPRENNKYNDSIKKISIIGDAHGFVDEYKKIIEDKNSQGIPTIQVGDFGFKQQHDWFLENIDYLDNRILFGNHDYYPYLNKPYSLGDYGYDEITDIFWTRGAWSIDYKFRRLGRDLFDDEELSSEVAHQAFDYWIECKPSIMITHDCPLCVYSEFGITDGKSITSNLLQRMFEEHQPKVWIYGHHHKDNISSQQGTKFICLNELSVVTLDVVNYSFKIEHN